MRLYKSHKVVAAAAIVEIVKFSDGVSYVLDDGDIVPRPSGTNYEPKTGDYYVVYEDSYASLSPKAAFESGYTVYDPTALDDAAKARDAHLKTWGRVADLVRPILGGTFNEDEAFAKLSEIVNSDWNATRQALEALVRGSADALRAHMGCAAFTLPMDGGEIHYARALTNDDEPELPLYEKDRECTGKCGECDCGSDKGNPHRHGSPPLPRFDNEGEWVEDLANAAERRVMQP